MKSGWRIGSLFGIPLFLDPSWFFILALVTIIYGSEWQSYHVADGVEWIVGFCMALLLFSSVLMHELGHSLVALSQGIRVHSITLFLFGGIASIEKESKTPLQALQVAIAGPAVSFLLFLGLTLFKHIVPLEKGAGMILGRLASINLILTIFNMMPGLPLDGGQVLKALIWQATGNRLKGMRWAARSGQIFGWVAICIGTILYLNSFEPVLLWLAVIGWFGIRNAKGYSRMANIQHVMLSLTATDVMSRRFRVADATLSVQDFIQQYLIDVEEKPERKRHDLYFAASNGRYKGAIDVKDLQQIERSQWNTLTLNEIAVPLTNIPSVTEASSLVEVISYLEQDQLTEVTVLSPAGAVAGVLDRSDIVTRIMHDLDFTLSSEMLDHMYENQEYPSALPLSQLARTLNDDSSIENSGNAVSDDASLR